MSLTGQQLLVGFSKFIADYANSTTTSAGGSDGSTLVDTALGRFGTDELRGMFVRITSAGSNQYAIRRVLEFAPETGTIEVRPVFPAQVASGATYEIHRYDPARKFESMDEARMRVYPNLAKIVYDTTRTGDGRTAEFTIPSGIRRGPAFVFEEVPLTVGDQWNFLQNMEGASTTGWTATGFTASIYTRTDADLIIPKYNEACTKLVLPASTTGTYTQTVANMRNSLTAAAAAGRKMALGVWVFCATANRVSVRITDDSGSSDSSLHQGLGWELLTVEKTIAANNATTLSATIAGTSGDALVAYWNRGWFYYGPAERVTDIYDSPVQLRVLRDDTSQTIELPFIPERGHQLQMVGRDVLSALGETPGSQVTNTMEVDAESAELLYAFAAQVLFEKEALTADTPAEVADRIGVIISRKGDYKTKWGFSLPNNPRIKGWWVA